MLFRVELGLRAIRTLCASERNYKKIAASVGNAETGAISARWRFLGEDA